jgi:uncharacterized protein (DUF362 family)
MNSMASESVSIVNIAGADEYPRAVKEALDAIGGAEALRSFDRIILKPNLVNSSAPPITTDVRFAAAVYDYLHVALPEADIIIAEGSGEGDSVNNLVKNGYGDLGVELVDLDKLPTKKYISSAASFFKEIFLPDILEGAALVSIPPAKDHTITRVTLGLKNMVGCLPASHYSGYWSYKKSQIHAGDEDQAVADLMFYCRPHLTVIDAREGCKGGHLSGRVPSPPIGKIVASTDVLAADREGARLLGHDPESIRHLELAAKYL